MQPIMILSLTPPEAPDEIASFACLQWEKGHWPKYRTTPAISMLPHTVIFVYDTWKILPLLKKYFGIDPNGTIIDIRDLTSLFYPTFNSDNLMELSLKITHKAYKTPFSPARCEVRVIWDLLKSCWIKGLDCDLGRLSRMEELTKGSSCQLFIQALKKEIVRIYPDRPIRTSPAVNGNWNNNLFAVMEEDPACIPDSPEWAVTCFHSDGLLAQKIPGYENRMIQATMAKGILSGLTEGRNVVIEAGTGTGKTLAYLVPALWYAKRHDEKVIVATHTITLQEQLYTKDLPLLQKALPFIFRTALLKGKGNYLCLKRLYQDNHVSESAAPEERLKLASILSWAAETETGDFGELPNTMNAYSVFKLYGADNPLCQPSECSYMSRCWLYKARKNAEGADVIVINHSLLLADIKTNNKILPEYSNLIIDEAHNIYQAALKQLGFEVSLDQLLRLTESIHGGRGSLYTHLIKKTTRWSEILPIFNWAEFRKKLEEIPDSVMAVAEQARELFIMFNSLLGGQLNLRLDAEKLGRDIFQLYNLSIENLAVRLNTLGDLLDRLNAFLSFESEQLEETRYEIIRIKNDIGLIIEGLNKIIDNADEEHVTYLEKSNTVYLKNTLINVAPILSKKIFSKNNCTVLTSATLSVADSFSYLTRDIGMEDYLPLKLDSPFDYSKQMLFCVVKDLPIHLPEDQLAERTASFITEIAEEINGGVLVLFTSHRYLRRVYQLIDKQLHDHGSHLRILAQGINGAREELLREFMERKESILLGTNSFWEGVDLPGDSLRCVIMVRLPFWPPDTPVMEAKARLLESQGIDPFYELNLPEAVIRFKQGFGRLIRTKEDRGVVIVLDDRIISKRYGRYFLKALPITSYYQGSTDDVLQRILSDDFLVPYQPLT